MLGSMYVILHYCFDGKPVKLRPITEYNFATAKLTNIINTPFEAD
jgi:hypothetical protein